MIIDDDNCLLDFIRFSQFITVNVYRLSVESGMTQPCLRSLHFLSRFHSWNRCRLSTKRDVFDVFFSTTFKSLPFADWQLAVGLHHPVILGKLFKLSSCSSHKLAGYYMIPTCYRKPPPKQKKTRQVGKYVQVLRKITSAFQAKLCGATVPHHTEHADTACILRYGFAWWLVQKASSRLWRQAATDVSSEHRKPNQGTSNWQLNNLTSQLFWETKKSACSHLPCPKPEVPSTENSVEPILMQLFCFLQQFPSFLCATHLFCKRSHGGLKTAQFLKWRPKVALLRQVTKAFT